MSESAGEPSWVKQAVSWNMRVDVCFEVAKTTAWRELVIIKRPFPWLGETKEDTIIARPIRGYRFNDFHSFVWPRFQMHVRPQDVYLSAAKFAPGKMPLFPNDVTALAAAREDLKKRWDDLIGTYDFAFDIDTGGVSPELFEASKKAALDAEALLRKSPVSSTSRPPMILFTGTGWNVRSFDAHHVLGATQEERATEVISMLKAQQALARKLAKKIGLPTLYEERKKESAAVQAGEKYAMPYPLVDDTVYDKRRVLRVPFTVNCKSGLVCLPLTRAEAEKATLDTFRIENIPTVRGWWDRVVKEAGIA